MVNAMPKRQVFLQLQVIDYRNELQIDQEKISSDTINGLLFPIQKMKYKI